MTATREVLAAGAVDTTYDLDQVAAVLDALGDCEATSTTCAVSMLAHMDAAGFTDSIRADLDFVDIAIAARRVLSRGAGTSGDTGQHLLQAVTAAAKRSNAACARHADHHAHCRLCAEASQRAVQACRALTSG